MVQSSRTEPDRYRQLRVLGRGGMGAVWLVEDARRQQTVAMKRVLGVHGDALRRFKREFRVIERLIHPNVVRLYELDEDDQGLFFTMEVVDGFGLSAWCRGVGVAAQSGSDPVTSRVRRRLGSDAETAHAEVDELAPTMDTGPTRRAEAHEPGAHAVAPEGELRVDRLAHVLPQLLEALAFLHSQGVVHRDLKPGNIMVRRDGVLKLLDFGILGELASRSSAGGEVVGTVGYMSLEQIRGAPATTASDLYSLGAVLFELVAGVPPFMGPPLQVMTRQMSAEPPRLRERAPDALPELDALCFDLMAREPDARPGIREVAERVLPALGARQPVFPRPRPPRVELLGRAEEERSLASRLETASAGSFEAVVLSGPTGAGKTALAAWLADEAARRGAVVLRGSGRPSERVAFNAVDGAIDELAGVLGRKGRREAEETTRARRTASSAFPVLAGKRDDFVGVPMEASQRRVFDALIALLEDVAGSDGAAVIWIDDLQWADADSVSFLDHLVERAPLRVLLVTTLRDDVAPSVASEWLGARDDLDRIAIRPLPVEVVREIVLQRARDAGVVVDAARVDRLAQACAGRPFLAEVAGRMLGRSSDDTAALEDLEGWIGTTLAELAPAPRALVALLVAADAWSRVGDLADLSARPAGDVEDDLRLLELDGIVRRAGGAGPEGSVDIYHDVVRASAQRLLEGEPMRRAHDRWAERLLGSGGSPAKRVRHLLGADRREEAARTARDAAREAEDLRAHGLAADMYAVALEHPGEDRDALLRARGEALERGGRYGEAAECWRELATTAQADEHLDLALREAHALLAGNEVTAGRRRLDEALVASGEPPSGRGGLAGLWAGIAFLRGPRPPGPAAETPDPERIARAERDVRIGTIVTYFDPLSGIRFLRRARAELAAAGAAEQVARSDYVFAYLALFGQKRRGPVALAERYRRSADLWAERAARLGPVTRAYPGFIDGVAAQRDGRWDDAAETLDASLGHLEEAGLFGTFEHMLGLVHRAQIDLYGERLDRVDESLGRLIAASRDSDDSAIHCHVEMARVIGAILRGEIESARDTAEALAGTWRVEEPTFQRILVEVLTALPTVYLGGAREAHARLVVAFREARRFRPLSSMYGGNLGSIAALVEAAALRDGDDSASLRRIKRMHRLAREAPPLATGAGLRALAYAVDARGRPEEALGLLREARAHADQFQQPVQAAITDFQLGARLGGDEGAALVARAREAARIHGFRPHLLLEDPAHR